MMNLETYEQIRQAIEIYDIHHKDEYLEAFEKTISDAEDYPYAVEQAKGYRKLSGAIINQSEETPGKFPDDMHDRLWKIIREIEGF